MEKRVSASARVTVTMIVEATDSWGPDCTVEQIYRQAAESVRCQLERIIEASNVKAKLTGTEVQAVFTERAR